MMTLESLFILFALLPMAFVAHALFLRLRIIQSLPRQLSVFPAVGSASAIVLSMVLLREEASLGVILFSLFICAGISHIYFHIFNMGETARRIRILVGLKLGGKAELSESYDPKAAIEVRLDRLVSTHQVDETKAGLLSKKCILLYAALAVRGYETILFGGTSGKDVNRQRIALTDLVTPI